MFRLSDGKTIAAGTTPGAPYKIEHFTTDALFEQDTIFAALVTTLMKDDKILVTSSVPMTCEYTKNRLKYFLSEPSRVKIACLQTPQMVRLDDSEIAYTYSAAKNLISLSLPAGTGEITH